MRVCKECYKKKVSSRYYSEESHKKIQEYELKRNKTDARRLSKLKYQQKRRVLHKDRYTANGIINNSIKKGLIKKQPCVVCNSIKSEAHHPNYSKPLEVIWFCLKHHREEHKRINNLITKIKL
jgi:hypothetical protein